MRQPGFESWLCPFQSVIPWAKDLAALCLSSSSCETGMTIVPLRCVVRIESKTHKVLKPAPAHSKCSTNIGCGGGVLMMMMMVKEEEEMIVG